MRAVTGAVVSSKPCSLAKAIRILARFADSAASHLPSSDAATYLRTAAEAANDLYIFRRDLRKSQQQQHQGGNVEAAHEGVEREGGESESEKRHRRERDQDRELKAEAEENGVMDLAADPQGTSGEKKSKKKKRKEVEEHDENAIVPNGGLHSPACEKRKRKKEKHLKEEDQTGNVEEKENSQTFDDGFQVSLLEDGIDKEKSGKKKKHLKQEEEARGAKETDLAMIHVDVANEKKKRKKMKREEEEKKEIDIDGDLGSDKKRKKKRSRSDDIDNGADQELVEHTNKKQRK